jgi:hypothetical protein
MTNRTDLERASEGPSTSPVARGLMGLGAAAMFAATFAAAPAAVLPDDCTLTFEPAAVVAGGEAVEVQMVPSEDVEAPDAVLFQEESGLTGTLIEERPFHVTVDPSAATEGEWLVTIQRERLATCTGTLRVSEGT